MGQSAEWRQRPIITSFVQGKGVSFDSLSFLSLSKYCKCSMCLRQPQCHVHDSYMHTHPQTQRSTHPNPGSHDDRQQPPHHIAILPLPWLLLLWQPGHHVQPSRGRKRENGNTHSEAGAFLLMGVPIMAASSLSSKLSQCLVLSYLLLWFLQLLHLLKEPETVCPSCRISQALGGSEW